VAGIVWPGSEEGESYGFSLERFDPRSYMYVDRDCVYISHIHTTVIGLGYFHDLVVSLLSKGLTIKVPAPYQKMKRILQHYGARLTIEFDARMGPCEVWVLLPPEPGDSTMQSSLA
jgi:hypothetical protein